MENTCAYCGENISDERAKRGAKFCSAKCSSAQERKKFEKTFSGFSKLDRSPSTVGAMHELMVCADLMRKGYHVFRAQSPSSPCDLVVLLENQIIRIEVTTGCLNRNGTYSFPHKNERYKYDVMAIAFHDGNIIYIENNKEIELKGKTK